MLNPNQCVGGAPRALPPPSRYRSDISMWFEIMSSPLVTFNFKKVSKAQAKSVFKFFGTNLRNTSLKTRGQHRF